MDIVVKMDRFQILQNILNVKYTVYSNAAEGFSKLLFKKRTFDIISTRDSYTFFDKFH